MPTIIEPRSWGWRLFWVVAAFVMVLAGGRTFIANLRPETRIDFEQEWSSARNFFAGRPVYEPLKTSMAYHLGDENYSHWVLLEYNAHPPTSIFLALPFAWLSCRDATFDWNLISLLALAVSLYLICRELGVRFGPWALFPTVALGLLCQPLGHQLARGQLNFVLLLLVTACWVADRNGRPVSAGVFLGTAVAIKLYPGLLFLYFVLQRRWYSVLAGIATVLFLTAVTIAVLGMDAYRSYVHDVLPSLQPWLGSWSNASLRGYWCKLFDPHSAHYSATPLFISSWAALLGTVISAGLVLGFVIWATLKSSKRDLVFAVYIPAMLLLSPITWDHYFVLLALPLALLWLKLPPSGPSRWVFRASVTILWLNPAVFNQLLLGVDLKHGSRSVSPPWATATVLSLQTYALIAILILGLLSCLSRPKDLPNGCGETN